MTPRLHKTGSALIQYHAGKLKHTRGLVDPAGLLSLTGSSRGGWTVSSQRNGLRLHYFGRQADARLYMEYLLEHAGALLEAVPLNPSMEVGSAVFSGLRKIHFEAIGRNPLP